MNGFEKRRAQKKDQIIKTTMALLNEKPLCKISTREIALKAEVSKVSIFNFFETKEMLITAVFEHYLEKVARLHQKISCKGLNFEETFNTKIQLMEDIRKKIGPQFYQNMIKFYKDEYQIYMNYYFNQGTAELHELFQKGRDEGFIRPDYSDELLTLYFAIFTNGMRHPKVLPKTYPYTRELFQMFLKGLR